MIEDIKDQAIDWFEKNYSANCDITNILVLTHRPSNIVWNQEKPEIGIRVGIDYEFNGKERFCEFLRPMEAMV